MIESPLGAPDEVVQSLAAALLWVDAALMSLDDGGTSWVRTALLNARTELRSAIRTLRGPRPN